MVTSLCVYFCEFRSTKAVYVYTFGVSCVYFRLFHVYTFGFLCVYFRISMCILLCFVLVTKCGNVCLCVYFWISMCILSDFHVYTFRFHVYTFVIFVSFMCILSARMCILSASHVYGLGFPLGPPP